MTRSSRRAGRPMDCREVARRVQRYLDHDLDAVTTERLEVHVAECEWCGLDVASYRHLLDTLAARRTAVSAESVARLRTVGERLIEGGNIP